MLALRSAVAIVVLFALSSNVAGKQLAARASQPLTQTQL